MATDPRAAILAKLDEYAADHQPCDPGADCIHRAVAALREVLELHRLGDDNRCEYGCFPFHGDDCPTVRGIAEALGIEAEDGGQLDVHEIKAGMAFAPAFVLLGSKRERTRMLGNAVTPPAARDMIAAVVEAITGEDLEVSPC